MNRKFSINSIALGTIRRRRGRYLLLIVGIVLAIYFVAIALLFADTMFTSLREQHYNRFGEQDAVVFDCGEEPLTELITTGIFSEYGTAEILGYVLPDNEDMESGFSIARFGENALKLTRKEPLEGRLPVKAGEIALERSALARLRSNAGVGDRITLTLLIPNGTGFMETPVEKSYSLVGILSDKLFHLDRSFNILPAYGDCPASVLFAGEQIEPGGRAVVNCYGRYAGDAAASFEKLKGFFLQTEAEENAWWSKLQQTHYQPFGSSYNGNQDEIILTSLFFTIIASVLVCAACLGIINTFSADLASRRRQIGLFRAVGATQQQIRAIYGREATLLALCAVPLGLALAAFTVRGITGLLGESFTFRLNALILALIAVAGITCVRLAAALPLRKAARIAPMQAIRDVELTRKLKRSRARSKTNFDVPRHLAHRSQALYRSRQAGITAMLALSIVLLSLVTFAAAPLAENFGQGYGIDYLMQNPSRSTNWLMEENFHRPGITEQDRSDAAALPAVKSVTGEKLLQVKILTDKVTPYVTGNGCGGFGYLTPEPAPDLDSDPESGRWLKQQHRDYLASKEKYGYARDYLTVDCCAADAAILEQLTPFVAEGRIDLDKLSAGEEILIAAPSEYGFYRGEQPGGGGSALQVDYGLSSSAEYEQILQNDIFFAGEPLDLSLLYSDLPAGHDRAEQRHGDGSRKLPENAVRLDKTVTIGAVLELRAGDLSLDSFFHSYYSVF
ncbi:MAG: FtsX-like permease family protein [Firmicutes bacterium]|nr:FtsX-like permease family protein [Bacillota bacterium]